MTLKKTTFRLDSYTLFIETGFYYLQSRYYDPIVKRFLNADSYGSTGQGFLGYNMFAYCRNNPATKTDVFGYADNESVEENENESPNEDCICYMFGVNEVEQIPGYEEGCMFFAENSYSVSLGTISIIRGNTIVMDKEKYCEYTFWGVSPGFSLPGCPGDATITEGIVYGINTPSDYSGLFFGGTANCVAIGAGGAVAPNGVRAKILGLVGYGAPSLGGSVTWYFSCASNWTYGKAPVQRKHNQYNGFFGNRTSTDELV